MTIKDIKEEARKKLALNIHQAIVIYTIEFAIFITLIALIVMSCVALGVNTPAAIVMICYGIVLCLIATVGSGMLNFSMSDFYLATYRCKPYNIRRLGDTLARSGTTKILLISLKRTVFAFLLLLCLIVPGVIYLIRTSMANYLLIANPKMKASTALSASNKVMSGKTGAYFALCASLIGWYLLGIITLGLGFVFILPYTNLIKAVYYKRNLQGDKTVYNTVVQPVVAASEPQNAVSTQAPQQPTQQPVIVAQNVAPVDALADEDVMDMTAAIKDFGGVPQEQVAEVKEVPIAPPVQKAVPEREPVDPVVVVEPVAHVVTPAPEVAFDNGGVTPDEQARPANDNASDAVINDDSDKPRVIDGTSIVETERILTTQEIDMSNKIRKQAIDAMYSHTDPQKPQVDYISMQNNKQDPNDFFDSFDDVPSDDGDKKADGGVSDDTVMSDSEFDEFLKNFDNATANEGEFKPLKRTDRAELIRNSRERRATREFNASARAATEQDPRRQPHSSNNTEITDRAERVRREREERLNQNNRK